MSLKMYFDQAGTQAILTAEKFTGSGPFTLVAFNGAQLGGVYKERKDSFSDIVFSQGIGSGFVGMTVDSLKGQRVIHGNSYVGQIVSNTDTTITIANLNYTASANACYLSSYVKLYTPTDFTLSGNVITMVGPVGVGETIHAVPIDTLAMHFGGTLGTDVTKTSTVYIKRTLDFEYTLLQVASDDTSLNPYHQTTANVLFSSGIGSGFSGLPIEGLVGKALNHSGAYKGIIVSNTASTVTLDTAYTGLPADAEIYNVGTLTFSKDNITFTPVLVLDDMTGVTTDAIIYVKDTVNIPSVAINYPSNIIKVSGIEYIA
jgi:hypothetical protein